MPFVPVANSLDSTGREGWAMRTATPRAAERKRRCEDLAVIDAVCDRFESSWGSGKRVDTPRPRIEGLLDDIPHRLYRDLLRELVRSEVELRRRSGEAPVMGEYRSRFPRDLDV